MKRSRRGCLLLIVGLAGPLLFAQQAAPSDSDGLQVVLRPATGSNRFRVGEVIRLEVLFSSTTANRYLEPCALFLESNFGFPQCRFFSHWAIHNFAGKRMGGLHKGVWRSQYV